jgi:L-iditol 2-dehydrogenase
LYQNTGIRQEKEEKALEIPQVMTGLFKTEKGPGNLELRSTQVPHPSENEVLIEVKAAGICGTDIHIRHDKFPYWPPVILGHEFSGVVVKAGERVQNFKLGDRIVSEPHTKTCGKCEMCRTGNVALCEHKRSPGWGIDGAFARYLVMPEHLLHRIPDAMSFEEAAVVEPTANVVTDVLERGRVEPNDFVAISGPGPIGLLSVMAAKAAGAREVALIGTQSDEDNRLPLGQRIGADHIIVAGKDDPVEAVKALTQGRGADLVVEASGAPAAIASTPHIVRRMGRITAIGMTAREAVSFPWDAAIWKVCTITFNLSTAYTSWDRAIGLIAAGKIDVSKIITHKAPLEDWRELFDTVERGEAVKALLIP